MRLKVVIGIVALVAGLASLMVWTSSQGGQPHYQLAEFHSRLSEKPDSLRGVYMTVYGNVKEGSIRKTGVKATFSIEEKQYSLNIDFTGKTLLPDTLKVRLQASVDGIYDFQRKIFVADKVLAKCASKYEGKLEGGPAGATKYKSEYKKEGSY